MFLFEFINFYCGLLDVCVCNLGVTPVAGGPRGAGAYGREI